MNSCVTCLVQNGASPEHQPTPQLVPVLFMPAPDIADKCPLPVGRRTGGIRVYPSFELRMQVIEVPTRAF